VLNEHEPLLVQDFESMLEKAAPFGAGYRHDDVDVRTVNLMVGERANGHAHCRALLLGPTACLNVVGGTLQLGRWQRVLFAELDGPRERLVSVVLFGEGRR
jgi:secondary thiamine-phosphate synthase enzyme